MHGVAAPLMSGNFEGWRKKTERRRYELPTCTGPSEKIMKVLKTTKTLYDVVWKSSIQMAECHTEDAELEDHQDGEKRPFA